MSTATGVYLCSRATELSLHRGLCMLTTDANGLVTRESDGFFVHQTRFLSRLRIVADGMAAAGACITGSDTCRSWFTAPAGHEAPGEIGSRPVEIQMDLVVHDQLRFDLRVSNHGLGACVFDLEFVMAADF